MTDDLDEDDPKLRQLRAVWIAMRDEPPPDRGLDALLAAARDKADTMRQPEPESSWIGRILRPPVLAFASITVLITGAVIVIGRDDHAAAPARSAQVSSPAPAVPGSPPVAEALQHSAPSDNAVPAPPPAAPPPQPRPASPPRHERAAPPAEPTSAELRGNRGGTSRAVRSLSLPQPDAEDADEPSLDQLVAQCLLAAERGECAAVRKLAARIAERDAEIYRTRVAKHAEIARCLER